MSTKRTVVKQKVVVGQKEPQVVEKEVEIYEGINAVAGNDLCRKCGNCCRGDWSTWIRYYYNREGGKKRVAAMVEKYPWFKEMWNKTKTVRLRDTFVRDSSGNCNCPDCKGKTGYCGMLEKKGKMFSCKIHRLIGFNAKPQTCRKHSCEKLEKALKKTG